jgi:hypothetical protein
MSKVIKKVWDDLLDVNYISPQPGIRYYRTFQGHVPRADNNPAYNNEPWYHGSNFKELDNSGKTVKQRKKI